MSPRTRCSGTPRQGAKSDDRRRPPRSHSREQVSGNPARVVDKKTRDERRITWASGVACKGSLRDLCNHCYLGSGAHVPGHEGRSRQDLGNPCHLLRHALGCEGKDVCHWACNCPNRQLLDR